jgi:hypothetical protein
MDRGALHGTILLRSVMVATVRLLVQLMLEVRGVPIL